jgi:TolB-like protein/Tfp pilus assembly protein PilF
MAEEHAPDLPITPGRDVFISYASQDAAIANAMVEALEKAGLKCWIAPRDVRAGAQYADAIIRALSGARALVLVLSENAINSAHVGKEIERASSKKRPIFALRIDAAPLTPALEYFLSESQWIEAKAGKVEIAYAKLIDAIRDPERTAPTTMSAATASRAPLKSRRYRILLAVGLVIVAATIALFAPKLWPPTHGSAVQPVSATAPTAAVSDKSIAVLPFVDMSERHDQEYFSDGMTEELIDRIAGAPDLKVIARTSSFQFKGKNEDVRNIALKLGVANLLEGSVRRSGHSLRVTAQLIRAVDGTHLWSHSYDELDSNIFKVQEAIAEKVARELEFALTTGPSLGTRTTNLQAYDAVQEGNYFWQRSEAGDADKALALFEEATRLDANYAVAWQKVARIYQIKGSMGELAVGDARAQAMSAVRHALAINPNLAEAHDVLGSIYRDFDWNWRAAKEEIETAARLAQNGGYQFEAGYLNWMLTGDFSMGIASLRQELVRDPLNTNTLFVLGLSYAAAQRYAESANTFLRLLELNPRYDSAQSSYANTLLFMGQYEKALAAALSDPSKISQWAILPCIYWKLGRRAESDAALRELEKDAEKSAYGIAQMSACRGETEQAFYWLDRAYRERQAGLSDLKFDPHLLSLHEDRRFQVLLRKVNLPE